MAQAQRRDNTLGADSTAGGRRMSMERLTEKKNGFVGYKDCFRDCKHPNNGCDCINARAALHRLAAYEDIGLEPKQVRKIANVLQEVGQEYNCRFEFVAEVVEKYAKYVKAERDGRLVVLPCKCGECEKYKSVSPKCGNCNRTTVIQHPEDYCNHGKEKSKILRNGENRK